MKKRMSALWMCCLLLLTLGGAAWAEESLDYEMGPMPLTVTHNGSQVVFSDAEPTIIDGCTMVPLRAVFEQMGCEVSFENGAIDAVRGDTSVHLELGSPLARTERDGQTRETTLDVAPLLIGERTMVPVRFIAEAFGCKVNWNPNLREAVILDADAWEREVKSGAPLLDLLFSAPLSRGKAYCADVEGTLSGTLLFADAGRETEAAFRLEIAGEYLTENGIRRLACHITPDWPELENCARSMASGERKNALLRLTERSELDWELVLDGEYNLYFSGAGAADAVTALGGRTEPGASEEKALMLPLGRILSDASGLPLGTILTAETVWDGVRKAVAEEEYMFTQTAAEMDNVISTLADCLGGTRTTEKNGESFASAPSDVPVSYQLELDGASESELLASGPQSVRLQAAAETQWEQTETASGAALLSWKAELTAEKTDGAGADISVPKDAAEWELPQE